MEAAMRPFQKQVQQFLMSRPAGAAWLGMGGGKTLTTLAALGRLREPGHILVVAPRNIAVDTWPQEVFDWGVPLRVTSLNITPPGLLNAKGRPAKTQRNLRPEEFARLVDSVPAAPGGLYTIGIDRFVAMSERIVYGGPPRVRPSGVPHPAGEFDLDAARDLFWPLVAALAEQDKRRRADIEAAQGADPVDPSVLAGLPRPFGPDVLPALKESMIAKLAPATKSGLPPKVVFVHPDPDKAAVLRSGAVLDRLAEQLTELAGAPLRAGSQIAVADLSNWPFPTVVIDEAQGFKNPESRRFKVMAAIRPYVRRVVELSGTPSPEGPEEIWPQIYLLDQGAALGTSYQKHLEALFTPEQMVNGTVTKWKISQANEEWLHRRISHLAISAEITGLKLPGYAPTRYHRVELSPELARAYKDFSRDSLLTVLTTGLRELQEQARSRALAKGATADQAQAAADSVVLDERLAHQIEAANGGVLRGKLIQFAAGAVYVEMDPSHPDYAQATALTKRPILRLHDGKLDKLEQILDEHFADPDPGSVLIAYRFDFEKALILDRLSRTPHAAKAFNGMPDMVRAWNRGEVPVMLLHPASAGHGLNLQHGGSTLIWTCLPESNEHFQQTPARLNRKGQTRPVTVHVLITAGTFDERQPGVLDRKQGSQVRLLIATRQELGDALSAILQSAA